MKFRVKKICLTRWGTSNRALQNLVWFFSVQLLRWSRGTLFGGSCQIWILKHPPSYWLLWDGGILRWGCGFRLWGRGGNWRWFFCLLGDCLNHWTVGREVQCHSHFLDVFSIPLHPQKDGWGCVGQCELRNPAGAVPQAEELTSELKLHLWDHFTNLQNLKKCAWCTSKPCKRLGYNIAVWLMCVCILCIQTVKR